MPMEHVNRRGDTHFLHEGTTKTGKPKYFFSRKQEGTLAEAIPAGYEVYENPNAQVFLRKVLPRFVTDEEVAILERGVREQAKLSYLIIDVKEKSIVVHIANDNVTFLTENFGSLRLMGPEELAKSVQKFLTYLPMMRFTLVDEKTRQFTVERWCFLGSIDDWFPLGGFGDLKGLVARYCPHLGQESFYEQM